jgi:hypothetical protein
LDAAAKRVAELPPDDFERERLTTFLTMELYNLNAEWIRHYYISVSMNQAVRKDGRRIVIGRKHQSREDAIAYAIEKLSGASAKAKWLANPTRFFEPSWNSINTLPRLAIMLNFPDRNQISTSISAARDSLNSLRTARNYYAHRNTDTRNLLIHHLRDVFGPAKVQNPSAEILNRRVGAFSNIFGFWLNDCRRINVEVCDR